MEESYLACQGDMTLVLANIQQSRITKLDELVASFNVDQKIAVSRLDDANWEISAASENMVLTNNQRQIDTYRPQLWRVEMTIPEDDRPGEDVDATLWQELNLFASEEKEMDDKVSFSVNTIFTQTNYMTRVGQGLLTYPISYIAEY